MAEGDGITKRAKHIDVRYHVTKEAIENGEIMLDYVRTEDQVADALTKNLGRIKFKRLALDKMLGSEGG